MHEVHEALLTITTLQRYYEDIDHKSIVIDRSYISHRIDEIYKNVTRKNMFFMKNITINKWYF